MQEHAAELPGLVEEASAEYLGKWNRLVSATNWEKGSIICRWRERLLAAGAPAASGTDEAWSRCVGRVSPQHVGRLRRVHERFAATCEQYSGLYWTHFQAALDWSDAEMWLEGAVQNAWSVSQMRRQRWETLGSVASDEPSDEQIVAEEFDDDAPADETAERIDAQTAEVQAPTQFQDDQFGGQPAESDESEASHTDDGDDEAPVDETAEAAVPPARPFEKLSRLPAEVAEAFEQFKLALLGQKLAGWKEMSLDQALEALDGLKQMLLAPTDAPF